MPHAIAMPKPGQFTEECTVVKWLKREGDAVAKGDVLFEIETDKSAMEVESFFEGTLLKILVPDGGTVPVQTVVGFVGRPGEPIPETVAPPRPAGSAGAGAGAPPPPPKTGGAGPGGRLPAAAAAPAAVAPPTAFPAAPPAAPARLRISPRARRLARQAAVDPAPVRGSGPGGRIVERDVKAYLAERGYDRLRVTPAAKALASAKGVDLLATRGRGPGGRITVADVEEAIAEQPQPLSRMRQAIAQRMTQSVLTAPHFFVTVSADLTNLLALRLRWKREKRPWTLNDVVLAATVASLGDVPAMNATTDGRTIRRFRRVHLGFAVALDDGLVVPVIRDADRLSLGELHDAAAGLAQRAREGRLGPGEMGGGTFTVSNMGMLDVENFTAIINPGETGILAVASAKPTPVARGKRVVVRTMMKLTVSADHRVVDGATAARFAAALRARLEDAAGWRRQA